MLAALVTLFRIMRRALYLRRWYAEDIDCSKNRMDLEWFCITSGPLCSAGTTSTSTTTSTTTTTTTTSGGGGTCCQRTLWFADTELCSSYRLHRRSVGTVSFILFDDVYILRRVVGAADRHTRDVRPALLAQHAPIPTLVRAAQPASRSS